MKIGIKLPNSGPFANAAFLARAAKAAEDLHFDSVWVHDHVSRTQSDVEFHFVGGAWEAWERPVVPNVFEAVSTLAFVAGMTSTISVGTSIIVLPLRNPVWLAKTTATIDALSNGRFVLGVGVGGSMYVERELRAMGRQDLFANRGAVVDEWIDVIRSTWESPSLTYKGTFLDVEDAVVYPKPTRGSIPIWIGGSSGLSRRRTAARGDGWLPMFLQPDELKRGMDEVRELAAGHGRDPAAIELASEHWLAIDDDTDRAIRRSEATRGGMAKYTASIAHSEHDRDVAAGEGNLIGDDDTVAAAFAGYRDAGVDHLILRVIAHTQDDYIESLHRFADIAAAGSTAPS